MAAQPGVGGASAAWCATVIRIDASSPLPVYEQIREQVTRLVASGRLQPGQQLPTIRQLALDLGVAKATVSRAYELLERTGVVIPAGRHGTVVASRSVNTADARADDLAEAAETFALVAVQLGASRAEAAAAVRAALDRLSNLR